MTLTVIHPPAGDPAWDARLDTVLTRALARIPHTICTGAAGLDGLRGRPLLFALPLGPFGICEHLLPILLRLRREPDLLEGCVAGLIVDGSGPLYTKSAATELALALNGAGCALVGRPLVEGAGDLQNLRIQAKNGGQSLSDAYVSAAQALVQQVLDFHPPRPPAPRLLVLHASSRHVSNTMDLWEGVRARLDPQIVVEEIGLRNGTVADCSGCPYTTCLHFGEQGGCFYGGVISQSVYPAIRRADGVMMICPNYNDALSANLTAFINRLTALFRQTRFYDKSLFAIVVSGYSGGDIVARQLISALNMNKSFYLPPRFALIETANDPGEALALPGISHRMDGFAQSVGLALCPAPAP